MIHIEWIDRRFLTQEILQKAKEKNDKILIDTGSDLRICEVGGIESPYLYLKSLHYISVDMDIPYPHLDEWFQEEKTFKRWQFFRFEKPIKGKIDACAD